MFTPADVVPEEIKRWNWGAFFGTWLWAIGNRVWVGLWALVPGVSLIMTFVLAVKGNEWAWRSRRWDSVEHFRRVQRIWAWAGLAILLTMQLPAHIEWIAAGTKLFWQWLAGHL